MKKKTPAPYIAYILESIPLIESYVSGGKEQFLHDPKTNDAVLHRLHTLAEATFSLNEEIKQENPNIPWKSVMAFRHILVHEYLGTVDHEKVWDVIVEELPKLQNALNKYRGML